MQIRFLDICHYMAQTDVSSYNDFTDDERKDIATIYMQNLSEKEKVDLVCLAAKDNLQYFFDLAKDYRLLAEKVNDQITKGGL